MPQTLEKIAFSSGLTEYGFVVDFLNTLSVNESNTKNSEILLLIRDYIIEQRQESNELQRQIEDQYK